MEKLVIALSAVVCALAIFVFGYKLITDKIIKEQLKEIAVLRTENNRLKSALRGAKYVTKIVYSDKPVDYPPTVKITKPQERLY